MFDSVLNKGNVQKSRFGTGTIISIVIHASLVAIVVYLTTRPPPVKEDVSEVKFFAAAPPPPPPPPPPPAHKKTQTEHKVVKKPDAIIQPKEIPQEKPKEAEPQKEEPASSASDDDGVEGGVEGGVVGGVVGGVIGGVIGGTVGGTGTEVVAFGEGMTRPVIDIPDLQRSLYTREAREAQVHGMMIVKCKVLNDGTIEDCRVIKTLPFLGESVIKKLQSMRAKPGTFQGKPISIDYVFNFNFQMPH